MSEFGLRVRSGTAMRAVTGPAQSVEPSTILPPSETANNSIDGGVRVLASPRTPTKEA